jgi:hypothetical protein
MSEEEVRLVLWTLSDMFPRHPRHVAVLSQESAQEMQSMVDRMVPTLKRMIEGMTREVVPND